MASAMPHVTTTMFQARPGYASGALCFAGTKVRVETLFNWASAFRRRSGRR